MPTARRSTGSASSSEKSLRGIRRCALRSDRPKHRRAPLRASESSDRRAQALPRPPRFRRTGREAQRPPDCRIPAAPRASQRPGPQPSAARTPPRPPHRITTRGTPRGGGVRRVIPTTVVGASVLLSAFLVLQRVMRLYSSFGIPPETEPPDYLGRPVGLGGPGRCCRG